LCRTRRSRSSRGSRLRTIDSRLRTIGSKLRRSKKQPSDSRS